MTRDETAKVLAVLTAAFPNLAGRDGTMEDARNRLAVWHDAFETFDYPTMMLAAREVIRSVSRTPTIADLGEAAAAIMRRQQMERPRLESGEVVVSPVEGLRRAWEGYVNECRKHRTEPKQGKFLVWMGADPSSARHLPAVEDVPTIPDEEEPF